MGHGPWAVRYPPPRSAAAAGRITTESVMRTHVLIGACALAAYVVLANAGPAAAQAKGSADAGAAKRANPNWKAPRNAWGQPDLEGIWTTDDMRGVPMSRPAQFGTRAYLTDEEFAAPRQAARQGPRHRQRPDGHVPQRGRHARLQLHVDGHRPARRPRAAR